MCWKLSKILLTQDAVLNHRMNTRPISTGSKTLRSQLFAIPGEPPTDLPGIAGLQAHSRPCRFQSLQCQALVSCEASYSPSLSHRAAHDT